MPINQTFLRIPHSLAALVLTLFVACASTGPRDVNTMADRTGSRPYPVLAARIERILADTLFPPSSAGIMIYSLTRREVLYSLNPDLLFAPGSNQKLITAAAALELLDADFHFATDIFIDSVDSKRLIIRGSGDPLLDETDLDSIASLIAQMIDSTATWELVGDQSRFDNIPKGKGWMWDDDPYVAPISAFSLNGNSIEVLVRPGLHAGDPTTATLMNSPPGLVALDNHSTTGSSGKDDSLTFERSAGQEIDLISIEGTIGPERKESRTGIGVSDPGEYFLKVLSAKLASHGVTVANSCIGIAPEEDPPLFTYSREIDSVLHFMLKESDNLSGECLFRTLGRAVSGQPGSTEGGILALKTVLHRFGIDSANVGIADGSGVSRYNLATARVLIQVLEALYQRGHIFERFRLALPVAGVDGTLSTRMKGTPAQGKLMAKTGTLRGASSLSGYVTMADGEFLAFAILMQNYPTGPRDYRNAQDSIGVYLSASRRSDF